MVILVEDKALPAGRQVTPEQIKLAAEDYFGEYIKIVVDIESGAMTIGGEWHADGEKFLLANGCHQKNLWGGGVDLKSKQINYSAMTNIKSQINKTHVIEDLKIRELFDKFVYERLSEIIG